MTFNQIRAFLGQCIACNRFCPEGPGRFDPERNVSFYVTSDGDGDGRVVNQKETMLRVSPSKTQVWMALSHYLCNKADPIGAQADPCADVARRIDVLFGVVLKESCHLPRDALCSTLQHVIGHFRPDLRGLVHENVFAFKRILAYLRLDSELSGVEDHVDVLPPPYVRSLQV